MASNAAAGRPGVKRAEEVRVAPAHQEDITEDPAQGIESALGLDGLRRRASGPKASSAAAVVTSFMVDAGRKAFSAFRE